MNYTVNITYKADNCNYTNHYYDKAKIPEGSDAPPP